ncbi:MAG: hypothetical protein Q9190_003151 [Brigantiaea leucoxantha]
MLRLPCTRIGLTSADIESYTARRKERQSGKATGVRPRATDNSSLLQSDSSSSALSPNRKKGNMIFAEEPVPKESREYWNGVLLSAGTSARISPERPSRLLQSAGTISGSGVTDTQGYDIARLDYREHGEPSNGLPTPCSLVSDDGSETSSTTPLSSAPQRYRGNNEIELYRANSSSSSDTLSRGEIQYETLPRGSINDDLNLIQASCCSREPVSFTKPADLDGPSDVAPASNRHRRAELTVTGPGSSYAGPSVSTLPYRQLLGQSLRASHGESNANTIGIPFRNHARMAELSAAYSRRGDLLESSPTNTSSPRPLSPNSVGPWSLPDRKLHHSHTPVFQDAAFGSSRNYQTLSIGSGSHDIRREIGLLSHPPRRRKKYRRRSRTNSFVESEASAGSSVRHSRYNSLGTPFDDSSIRLPSRLSSKDFLRLHQYRDINFPASSPANHPVSHFQLPASQNFNNGREQQSSHISEHSYRGPTHSSLPNLRGLSSYTSRTSNQPCQSPLRHALPSGSPALSLPPPFNSSSRIVLSNVVLPSASPITEDDLRFESSSSSTAVPTRSSVTQSLYAPSAGSARIQIYNDGLPASSQPQTPVGLPRNGLPRMEGLNTAPEGGFVRQAESQQFTAPTRRGRGRGSGRGRGRVPLLREWWLGN